MGTPNVSVVIRCYNEREHIGKLLHGIFEQNVDGIEVVLVDSGSTDGTLEVAKEYPIDDIVYIPPEDFSFGRALNMGIEATSGKYCVFASAHVYPKRTDWISTLIDKFEEDIALVYGKQRGDDRTKFSEKRVFRTWFPDHDRVRQETPFCNNANCAIRRSVWEEFKYNEDLPGLEDLDWAKRVRDSDWEISYASDATVVHVHEESPREVYNRYRREALAHRQIMPDQEFSLIDFLKTFSLNALRDYRAAFEQGKIRENLFAIPRFRLMQFWGTYRGFTQSAPVSQQVWQRFYYPDTEGYPEDPTAGDEPEKDAREKQEDRIDYTSVE